MKTRDATGTAEAIAAAWVRLLASPPPFCENGIDRGWPIIAAWRFGRRNPSLKCCFIGIVGRVDWRHHFKVGESTPYCVVWDQNPEDVARVLPLRCEQDWDARPARWVR